MSQPYQSLNNPATQNNTLFEVPQNLELRRNNDNLRNNESLSDPRTEERDQLVDAFASDSDSDSDSELEDDRILTQDEYGMSTASSVAASATATAASVAAAGIASARAAVSTGTRTQQASRPQPSGNTNRLWSNLRFWDRNGARSSLTQANSNDGVFANMTAKPEVPGENNEDIPPSYEEASSDQTPPYWETTILTDSGFGDEVFIDGLLVGTPFNFIWSMMVSSAFQFVGFLLTYLLHTSHAAKQGSRAGLGFTLFQYGFFLKPEVATRESGVPVEEFSPDSPNDYEVEGVHDFDQKAANPSVSSNSGFLSGGTAGDSWISIGLIVLGVIIIMKSVLDYNRARKMEKVIMQPSQVQPASPTSEQDIV